MSPLADGDMSAGNRLLGVERYRLEILGDPVATTLPPSWHRVHRA